MRRPFEYGFGERFIPLGGFRYDRQSHGFGSEATAVFTSTLPDPTAFGPELALAIEGIHQAVPGFVA